MKNSRNLMEYGITFIVALLSYLMIGPVSYALVFPFLEGRVWSYAALFIPSVISLASLLVLRRKRFFKDFKALKRGEFSVPLFLLFLFSSFIILSVVSLIGGATPNSAPLLDKISSLLISLIFIPIQITMEEYIFRVIIIDAVDKKEIEKRSMGIVISLISALLFTLPHLFNREVWVEGGTWALIHYFLWGFLAAFSSILTEGFEMAVAMHLSNNLVVSIVANYKGSSLSSVSFYLLENETSSPKAIMAFVLLFAFELFLFYILKKRGQK